MSSEYSRTGEIDADLGRGDLGSRRLGGPRRRRRALLLGFGPQRAAHRQARRALDSGRNLGYKTAMLALGLSAFLLAVSPPAAGGPWDQLGATVTSKPGKLAHFFRSATSPTGLAVVATSSSSKPIRMTWFSYCEFESDDAQTEQNQATVTGTRRVIALPHVLDGATLCTVSVTIRVANGRAAAAVFGD